MTLHNLQFDEKKKTVQPQGAREYIDIIKKIYKIGRRTACDWLSDYFCRHELKNIRTQ